MPFPSEHFAPPEYQQYPQNWGVTQDHRGLIYVANNDGILEYDGESWRLIPTATNTFVRSLTTAEDGTVYAGTVGDFGMLRPDSMGVMRYTSLFDRIPEAHHSFKDVWGTHATAEGVYFQAKERLFRWDDAEMAVWTSEEGFHTSFVVRDTLYVRDFEAGLLRMVDDSLQAVPGGQQFADTPVHAMVPLPDGRILVGTNREGLYVYDGQHITPFATEAQPFLDEYELYHGSALPDGHIALATIGGGVIIIDRGGRLVRVLGPSAELPDGVVHHVYQDREGGLWMAFNSSGLARADVVSPLSMFDQRLGLDGLVYSIERHQDRLYVATGSGLFVLEPQPLVRRARQSEQHTAFRRVDGIPIAWDAESTPHGLMVATDRGVFLVQGDEHEQLTQGTRHAARTVEVSEQHADWFFIGERQGLMALHRSPEGWEQHPVAAVEEEIHSLVEGPSGALWLNPMQGGVLRLQFEEHPSTAATTERFQQGALPDGFNRVTKIAGELLVISEHGVFDVRRQGGERNAVHEGDPTTYNFVRDDRFQVDDNEQPLLSLFEAETGDVWMLRGERTYRGQRQPGGTYRWHEIAALHFPKAEENPLFIDADDVVWMGNGQELIRYDAQQTKKETRPLLVHIRQVTTLQDQQVLYGGTPSTMRTDSSEAQVQVPYQSNDLRFDFAAPQFGNIAPVEYQYRLEGHDAEWSAWQANTNVVYSSLTEGKYVFHVRARTQAGTMSPVAALAIAVQPPWYRTGWAYAVYAGLLFALGLGYRRYRRLMEESERAKEQAKELERERMANERLQEANRRLKQANELKDNFLANTSHELRTPLTTILGFTDVLKDEAPPHHREFLEIIEKSGQRLLRTLNALLDLAKLRSGVAEAQFTTVDVVQTSSDVMAMFEHKAKQKGIRLELIAPDMPVHAALDERYYEQILDNLLSNAVKFTDDGEVQVEVTREAEQVQIQVRDTGVGIDEDFLPHLFDDFKQESSGLDRDHEGNGLGLAITARLVELMHGTIDVESTKGEGSTFAVTFPRHVEAARTPIENAKRVGSEQPS